MPSNNLGTTTVRAFKWTTLASITNTLLQIGYTSVMARLLSPSDFGLVAMSAFVMRFGGYFAQMGMGQALIQKKEISSEDIRVAFTSTFFLGLLFTGLFYLLAPLSILIFDNPKIVSTVRVMSLSFFLSGLGSTSMNLLRKKMDFKSLSIVEMASHILGYLSVGILLAYNGFAYWSIIIAGLAQIVFSAIISYSIVRHEIRFIYEWKYYKPLLSFGGKVSLISLLEFLRSNLSTLVVGRLFSANLLGIYNRAYELINLPVYYITLNFSKVLFPAFSIIQNEKKKLKMAFLSFVAFIGFITIPICLGAAISSEQLILTLLGEKFIDSIPVLSIVCLGMPFRVFSNISGIICEATATLNIKVVLQIAYVTILSFLYYIFRNYGLEGIAISFVITEFLMFIWYLFVTRKLLSYTYNEIFSALFPGILTGAITGLFILAATYLMEKWISSPIIILFLQLIIGVISLFSLLFIKANKSIRLEIHKRLLNLVTSSNVSLSNRIISRLVQILANSK